MQLNQFLSALAALTTSEKKELLRRAKEISESEAKSGPRP